VIAEGLPGGEISLKGSVSSQYLTAILMASPLALGDINIVISDTLVSVPYVDMTIKLMQRFGVKVPHPLLTPPADTSAPPARAHI
jgi:3-phosphoshikimate 1-carboxyvinyltransferase